MQLNMQLTENSKLQLEKEIEGTLKKIKNINCNIISADPAVERSWANTQTCIRTDIEIETSEGKVDLIFWGIIFPDSIGHNVHYTSLHLLVSNPHDYFPGGERSIAYRQTLRDLDLEREYISSGFKV